MLWGGAAEEHNKGSVATEDGAELRVEKRNDAEVRLEGECGNATGAKLVGGAPRGKQGWGSVVDRNWPSR